MSTARYNPLLKEYFPTILCLSKDTPEAKPKYDINSQMPMHRNRKKKKNRDIKLRYQKEQLKYI